MNVSKGNINIYVTDLDGNDGEYGSVSGAMYIDNKMKLPNHVSGIRFEDVVGHEEFELKYHYWKLNISK